MNEDIYELVLKAVGMIKKRDSNSIDDIGDILEKVGEKLNALLLH